MKLYRNPYTLSQTSYTKIEIFLTFEETVLSLNSKLYGIPHPNLLLFEQAPLILMREELPEILIRIKKEVKKNEVQQRINN